MDSTRRFVLVSLAALALVGPTASGQFVTGGLWNRFLDWSDPGEADPARTVWRYESINLADRSSNGPWYALPTTPTVWQPGAESSAQGRWLAEPNGVAIFQQDRARVVGGDDARSPVARWHNPAGDGSVVSVTGRVRFNLGDEGADAGLELVVAISDSSGNVRPLYTHHMSADDLESTAHRGLVVPIELRDVIVNQGDSIIITARVDEGNAGDKAVVVDLLDDVSIVMDGHQQTEDVWAFAAPSPHGGRLGGGRARPTRSSGGGSGTPPLLPPDPPELLPPDVPDEPVIPSPGTLVLLLTAAACTFRRRPHR